MEYARYQAVCGNQISFSRGDATQTFFQVPGRALCVENDSGERNGAKHVVRILPVTKGSGTLAIVLHLV